MNLPDVGSDALTLAGFWISFAGLVVSIVGFAATIYGVRKSKSAAESARDAAESARQAIYREEVIASFSSVISAMEEVKRLHRVDAWEVMPERYSSLRKSLGLIVGAHKDISEEHRVLISTAMTQFRELERMVESGLRNKRNGLNSAKLNALVTSQLDKLDEILNSFKAGRG